MDKKKIVFISLVVLAILTIVFFVILNKPKNVKKPIMANETIENIKKTEVKIEKLKENKHVKVGVVFFITNIKNTNNTTIIEGNLVNYDPKVNYCNKTEIYYENKIRASILSCRSEIITNKTIKMVYEIYPKAKKTIYIHIDNFKNTVMV